MPQPFGFTGELHVGGLVYLRARWYDGSAGTFTQRDPFGGFPEQPYSLHPYQYGYANPGRWTDASGRCIPTSPGCSTVDDLSQLNWDDGSAYVRGVNRALETSFPVANPAKQTYQFALLSIGLAQQGYALATSADARTALWQQVTDAATPSNWPGMAWRALPFDDLIAGWTCGDMERLGSGVVETGNLIIGAAGLVEAGQAWVARAGQTRTGWSRFNRPSGVAPSGNAGGVRLGGASAGSGGGLGQSGVADFVRVGRWMSKTEYQNMVVSGKVQESFSGTTHVIYPANGMLYYPQARPGSIYVEFDVPAISVKPTQAGWAKILGPNTLEGRLAYRKGLPVPQMPEARNIQYLEKK